NRASAEKTAISISGDLVRVYLGRSRHQAQLLQLDMLRSAHQQDDQPADTASLPLGLFRSVEQAFSDPEARFRFISADLLVAQDGSWTLEDLSATPTYPQHGFTEQARRFLGKRARRRRERDLQLQQSDQDGPEQATPTERRFAQRHGFPVEMVRRFGIDRDNVHKFVSERDFLLAQPFNIARDQHGDSAEHRDRAQVLYSIGRDGRGLRIRSGGSSESSNGTSNSNGTLSDLVAETARAGGALLGPEDWDLTSVWRVDAPAKEYHPAGTDVVVNGIGYSLDEFELLLTDRTADHPLTLISAGTGAETRPLTFSTEGSVQLRVSLIHEPGSPPVIADAFVVGRHDRKHQRAFREEGRLVGTEQIRRTGPSGIEAQQDTAHEAAQAHLAAGERAGIDVWPEGLRDLGGVDLIGRVHPRTGRVNSARAMVGTELYEYTLHPVTREPLNTTIPGWEALTADLLGQCEDAPELRYVEYTVVVSTRGHRVLGCSLTPHYPTCYAYSVPTVDFLNRAVRRKKHRQAKGTVAAV
ncbi:MAG: hypothetical protein ACTII7_13040, partial [Galactobacter sp.]